MLHGFHCQGMSGKNTNFSENTNCFANFPVVFWTTFRSVVLLLFCAFTLDCCAKHFELSASFIGWDDRYILDPNNPLTLGEGDFTNNLKVVKPNYTFTFPKAASTKEVRMSGDFLDWTKQGVRMQCNEDECFVRLHLTKGKFRYKFVVNGNWTLDPNNPLYEENQYGTGNSILWVE